MVIWLTGLAGSGKTTLSNALRDVIKKLNLFSIQLDGDVVRRSLSADLGYTQKDRLIHISRLQNVSKLLESQNAIVIVSALYFDQKISEWNKENFDEYIEVFLDASRELLEKRDQKSIYSRFRAGEIQDVVGLDINYDAPTTPNIHFKINGDLDLEFMTSCIVDELEKTRKTSHVY